MRVYLPTAEQLHEFGRERNPAFPFELAFAYAYFCPRGNIDLRFAFAQMCHETRFWLFGNSAQPEWNNPAGLGVNGSPGVGLRFDSISSGVMYHIAQLRCYYGPHDNWFCAVNSVNGRHFKPGQTIGMKAMPLLGGGTADRSITADANGHLNLRPDSSELDGRWAQGPKAHGYGSRITEIADRIK